MKKIILLSGLVLLLMNLLFGLIISFFDGFNVMISSIVIVITTLLLYLITIIQLKDGYKISLSLLFLITGVIEYALSLFAPCQIVNNWWLIIIILVITLEVIILVVTNTITKKANNR